MREVDLKHPDATDHEDEHATDPPPRLTERRAMMDKHKRIASLMEDLLSIATAASCGNQREPVWDGTVICKPNQHTLVKMGLVEHSHGYYFPTKQGSELLKLFKDV